MPGPDFVSRQVTVPLFKHEWSLLVGYLLFVIFLVSLYRGYKTRLRWWWLAAIVLFVAMILLAIVNIEIESTPLL